MRVSTEYLFKFFHHLFIEVEKWLGVSEDCTDKAAFGYMECCFVYPLSSYVLNLGGA
jgi:hypothetical protein